MMRFCKAHLSLKMVENLQGFLERLGRGVHLPKYSHSSFFLFGRVFKTFKGFNFGGHIFGRKVKLPQTKSVDVSQYRLSFFSPKFHHCEAKFQLVTIAKFIA